MSCGIDELAGERGGQEGVDGLGAAGAADTRPRRPLCCAARRLAAARLADGGVAGVLAP